MSQKVKIDHLSLKGGEVFVGLDRYGNPTYTRNPERVIAWMCDAWRAMFNNYREQRTVFFPKEKDADGKVTEWGEKPIGTREPAEKALTAKEARKTHSWMSCVPSGVLRSPYQCEWKEWAAAAERRKTLKAKGKKPGAWPRFKSSKRNGQILVCWRNESKAGNAHFRKTGANSGIVTIAGMTHREWKRKGQPAHWKLEIHVRVSEDVRDYTSVHVDWTNRELVFTNEPLPVERPVYTGKNSGIDLGCVHTMAFSDGTFLDIPHATAKEIGRYKQLQRELARKDRVNKAKEEALRERLVAEGKVAEAEKLDLVRSKRRQAVVDEMESIRRRVMRRKDDWCAKVTTKIVESNDAVCVEDLNIQGMTARCKAKPDPDNPGRWLPNGQSAKGKLNHNILSNRWGEITRQLEYKCKYSGVAFAKVDPAYTSQTCSVCGHVSAHNRESQAVFKCEKCGHEENADVNASKVVLKNGLVQIAAESLDQDSGVGRTPGRGSECKTGGGLAPEPSGRVTTSPDHADRCSSA